MLHEHGSSTLLREAPDLLSAQDALQCAGVARGFDCQATGGRGVEFLRRVLHENIMWIGGSFLSGTHLRTRPSVPSASGWLEMPKGSKRNISVTAEEIRGSVLRRYKKAFGCEWPTAPWGKPWPDVLREAQSADRDYVHATRLLTDLRAAMDAIIAYSRSCGVDVDAPLVEEAMHGRTRPEHAVFVFSAIETDQGKALRQLRDDVAELVDLMGARPEVAFSTLSEEAQTEARALVETTLNLVKARLDLHGPEPAQIDHQRKLYATHATRRVAPMPMYLPGGGGQTFTVGRAGTLLPDGPPRTLEGPEWRRNYLVQLLDAYPLRFDEGARSMVPPTDAEIALISLLAGGLDELATITPGRLDEGEKAVLGAERKAVAQARRRRTLVSRRLVELGIGTAQDVARAAGAAHREAVATDADDRTE